MAFRTNPNIDRVLDPPTGETRAWVEQGSRNVNLALIDAAQAVPSYPPSKRLTAHLAEIVVAPETAFYTPILGLPELRAALSRDVNAHYGASTNAVNMAITCGGNHAYCMAILALAGAGDNVLLPEPYYFNHQMWFDMQGIETVPVPCTESPDGLVPDLEAITAAANDRTRALILVSPNNPTGTTLAPEALKTYFDAARDLGIALVVDETYRDFIAGDGRPHDLFTQPDWEDVFVHLYTFSKVYSLTGYRVGAIAAGERMMAAIGKIADTMTICAPRISQDAALFGLRHLDDWRTAKRDDLLARIAVLDDAFARHEPPFKLVSRGAFFAYLRHPFAGEKSLDVSKRLFDDMNLLTWPGSFFGDAQEDYIRLAFANADAEDIEEMVRRLGAL